jgi:hypothetical protein
MESSIQSFFSSIGRWALIAIGVFIAGGLAGFLLVGSRQEKERRKNGISGPPSIVLPPPNPEPSAAYKSLVARLEFEKLEVEVRDLAHQVESLRSENEQLSVAVAAFKAQERRPEVEEVRREPREERTTPERINPEVALSQMFVDWCAKRGALVGHAHLFEAELQRSVPGAKVVTTYRDLDSPARPVEFHTNGGSSPAEYWIVEHETEQWLLPKPQNAAQFRDDSEEVFRGRVRPCDLQHIAPALVRQVNGGFVLLEKGKMS